MAILIDLMIEKTIFQKRIWIVGGLCLMSWPGRLPAQSVNAFYTTLSGYVIQDSGEAIKNVAVSDGTYVVWTDAQGKYTLQSASSSEFVFISVPAGYNIPVKDQLPAFYRKIDHAKDTFLTDFVLSSMKESDNHHGFILWADPQINTKEQAQQLLDKAVPDTKDQVRELEKDMPIFGIAAGDLTWDAPEIIPYYKKAISEIGIPFYQVPGNHDMNVGVRSDELSGLTFKKHFGPGWYSFNRGKAHYVVLDNVFYYGDGYNYIGYITEQQLQWLEQDLSFVKAGAPVFVAMHISAYTEAKRRNNATKDNPGSVTHNRKFLYHLLKPFNAHLLTGHTHYNENRSEEGVFEHLHASVCGSWWDAPICTDGTPGGYGVYEVDGNKVQWFYKSIGYSKNVQMIVYPPGSYPDRPGDIAVNVWNWDKQWKVEWYQDNVYQGAMKQEVHKDARAIRLLSGNDKTRNYSWIAPGLTDHIFFCTPLESAGVVTVVVTDRFCKQFKEGISINGQ